MTMLPCPSCGHTMTEGVAAHFAKCPIIPRQPRFQGLKTRGPKTLPLNMRDRLTRAEQLILLAEEFGYLCAICGDPLGELALCNIDHKIPKGRGGSNDWTNLQPAHIVCNNRKADKPMRPKVWPLRRDAPFVSEET